MFKIGIDGLAQPGDFVSVYYSFLSSFFFIVKFLFSLSLYLLYNVMQILYFIIKNKIKTYLSTYNDNIIFASTIVDCIIRF